MSSMIADAIAALMALSVTATLGPLSKKIYDEGAPWGLCAVLFAVALVAFVITLYFLWRVIKGART